jgi:S1-C subfamily serine protease
VTIGGVAGAQMGSLTQDWARLTGVAHGVLVMRAPAGSLAAESGLRDADVIVRAAGREVRTLPELRDLIAMTWGNGERAMAIEFVRERTKRSGMLRW